MDVFSSLRLVKHLLHYPIRGRNIVGDHRHAPAFWKQLAGLMSASLLSCTTVASAQWLPGGVAVAPGSDAEDGPLVTVDGNHGAFVAWRDYRSGIGNAYLKRITAAGPATPGWPTSGLALSASTFYASPYYIEKDAQGGAIVAWVDLVRSGYDIYAQRTLPNGAFANGWPAAGFPVVVRPGYQDPMGIVADADGGAYFVWSDEIKPDSIDIYVQRLTFDGQVAPGWPVGGRTVEAAAAMRNLAYVTSDGTGGMVVIHTDSRLSATPFPVKGANFYAARILPDGSMAPGWPVAGLEVVRSQSAITNFAICSDGAGGAYFAWNDNRLGTMPPNPSDYSVYAQHVLGEGRLDSRWPIDGLPVCTAPGIQFNLDLEADGSGGMLIAWEDQRNGYSRIFGQRIRPDGSLAPGWQDQGNLLSTRVMSQILPSIVPDGAGGMFTFWTVFPNGDYDIYGQHMRGDGTPAEGWTAEGRTISADPTANEDYAVAATDGAGGAYVAWPRSNFTAQEIYATRIFGDGPTSTRVSLAQSEVAGGEVRLRWSAPGIDGVGSSVYRRTETSEWLQLGPATRLSPELLEFVDTGLQPGRYAYRLVYQDGGQESFTEESWVTVTGSSELALAGFRPNPAQGAASMHFSLPDAAPAHLEIHDVRGRMIDSREVGSLGPGEHSLAIAGGRALPAGVYWLRLVRADRVLTARGVVVN